MNEVSFVAIDAEAYKRLEELKGFYNKLAEEKIITTNVIANIYGTSPNTIIASRRYLMPGFGRGNNGRTYKWTVDEFFRWQQIPLEQRREEYKRLLKIGEL